jgi:hypothetical protein
MTKLLGEITLRNSCFLNGLENVGSLLTPLGRVIFSNKHTLPGILIVLKLRLSCTCTQEPTDGVQGKSP